MPRVAVSSVVVLQFTYSQPEAVEYEDLVSKVFSEVEHAPGFIAHARPVDDLEEASNFERDWGVWGPFCAPSYYTGGTTFRTDHRASILALFTDVKALHDFTFGDNHHRYVLKNRRWWLTDVDQRTYAIWWVGDEEIPTWRDASDRIDHLNAHGPSPHAFDLHHLYDEHGRPMKARYTAAEPGTHD